MLEDGVVCIFSENPDVLYEQASYLRDRNYLVFSTSNVYKFVKYARELKPNVLIFDMDASVLNDDAMVSYLQHYKRNHHHPVVLIGSSFLHCYKDVAHYMQKPYLLTDLLEIVDSYCKGNQKHDVLLIDDCLSKDVGVKLAIIKQNLSCCEVSELRAARIYLTKNNPKCICLNLPIDKCMQLEDKLNHEKIFFVDNYKQVRNLARII